MFSDGKLSVARVRIRDMPKDVLDRYTALTGRPAEVPAWSYGTWLSTRFSLPRPRT